ncbi:hypothetical protein TB2_034012 [Malus domestica]
MKMYGIVNHINFVQSGKVKEHAYQSGKTSKQLSSYGNVIIASSSRGPEILRDNLDNVKCIFAKDMGI